MKFSYPGSIGEVLQGRVKGKDILVSFPVNLFTQVELVDKALDDDNYKAKEFLKNLLSAWGIEQKVHFKIKSSIPKGKGFASSTADLCALYHCLLKKFIKAYNQEELIKELVKIEPTDSIIFNRACAFEYKNGGYYEELGEYLEFYVWVFEGEKEVDTIEFNKSIKTPLADVSDLFDELKVAINNKDIKTLAQISTESIIRNQNRLFYPILDDCMRICKERGGLGLIGAHSGNMVGIIFESPVYLDINFKGYKSYLLKTLKKAF
ncbi:MAG: kinase [Caloramator sp.]|nr:kinase [Caloramator sp.]